MQLDKFVIAPPDGIVHQLIDYDPALHAQRGS
jgi:hypothetical protein